MPKLDGKVTHWMVTWTYPGRDTITTACSLTEGYTTVANFPAMIAIKRGLDATQVEILAMIRIQPEQANLVWCMVCGEGFTSIPATFGHPHFDQI